MTWVSNQYFNELYLLGPAEHHISVMEIHQSQGKFRYLGLEEWVPQNNLAE